MTKKPNMSFEISFLNTGSKPSVPFLLLTSFLLITYHGFVVEAGTKNINIGAIIDDDPVVGKEQKIAMTAAAQNFNHNSKEIKLIIHFTNSSRELTETISSAQEMIREKQVKVIVGMRTWEEATLVAEVGKQAQVAILSFAAAPNPTPELQHRWPSLLQMAPNLQEQASCIAAIVGSYKWRKVVTIHEEDMYGSDSGMLTLLSEALQDVGAEIEYRQAFPPFSTLSDPGLIVKQKLVQLIKRQSRVFLVLSTSSSLAAHLFKQAKNRGLMGRDSVWILANSVSNILDSMDASIISSMQGALGIKTYYSEENSSFKQFKGQFGKILSLEFPDEHALEPGFHAVQAYDSIRAVALAANKSRGKGNNSSSELLLDEIMSSNFTGLSGQFYNGSGLSGTPSVSRFGIVNVVGKKYKELGFWTWKSGFSETNEAEDERESASDMRSLNGLVNWPGELNREPKGWAMPSDEVKLQIGVPGSSSFEKFVKVEWDSRSNKKKYDGFCIELFEEVVRILGESYYLPYEFVAYNGTYNDLVEHVINKTFDAVVGDVTILANRSRYVDFTQPFAESGLSMLVPVKDHEIHKAWMFLRPFTTGMWVATYAIFFYTMFVIWSLELKDNSQFGEPPRRRDQLGTALWFTFSTLFFAHRENLNSNYSKVVVMVWLFVVFVVTSSYSASLTSMLTVSRLEPSVTDIEWLRRTNATVGCDSDSFVKDYLREVLQLQNIKGIDNPNSYHGEFQSGNIKAAFLERPFEKVFLSEHCNGYTTTGPTYKFVGLGFVFQKGSPIARDVSEAILTLSENGKLNELENKWFHTSMNCPSTDSAAETESLSLDSFWLLFLLTGVTSTICLMAFHLRPQSGHQQPNGASKSKGGDGRDKGVLRKTLELVQYSPYRRPTSLRRDHRDVNRWNSSRRWELVSPPDVSENFDAAIRFD